MPSQNPLLSHTIKTVETIRTVETTQQAQMAQVVERNIRALLERRQQEERRKGLQERIADRITKFTGSMTFVYLHLLLFGGWIAINTGLLPLPKFDPSLVILAMFASVEAIFLSTFVLISQNRMAAMADKRADLDLQISLLAEHEITRMLTLVTAIADRLQIQGAEDPELNELAQDVLPESVLDTIEATEQEYDGQESNGQRSNERYNGDENNASPSV